MENQAPKVFSKDEIVIIGGGIGGVALAVGLRNRGVPVHVFEAGNDFTELGAGLGLGPNAVASLKLLDPATAHIFENLATKNASPGEEATWMNWRDGIGEPKLIAKTVTKDERKTGISSVHRSRFLYALADLIPRDIVEFRKKLVRVEDDEEEEGRVRLSFEDGSQVLASFVVGCDGLRSCVRQYVLGLEHPLDKISYTKKYAYRGLVKMETAIEQLGEELAMNSQYYLGPHGHVISYPIDGGKYLNVAAFRDDEEDEWKHPMWAVKQQGEQMRKDFADWNKPVRSLLQVFQQPDKYAMFHHEPASTYVKGSVAILGDAAHAMTPHQGAGAGQALEDAAFFAALLEKARSASVSFAEAFKVYDAVRRPRSQLVSSTSLESGYTLAMTGPAGTDQKKIGEELERRWDWIWEYPVEQEVRRAVAQIK